MNATTSNANEGTAAGASPDARLGRLRVRTERFVLLTLQRIRGGTSFLASAAIHFLLVVVLAMWTTSGRSGDGPNQLVLVPAEYEPLEPDLLQTETPVEVTVSSEAIEQHLQESSPVGELAELVEPLPEQFATNDAASAVEPQSDFQKNLPWQQAVPSKNGGGFEGRSGQLQQELLAARGGSAATEDAVTRALAWIAAHQLPDGSWSFDHHRTEIGKRSPNPGDPVTATGATGLALLPFLGKGYTHLNENPYRDHIEKGLYYLTANQIIGPNGGDLQAGSMYGHGLATIALCEAYAMTEDPSLKHAAEEAVRFIEYAQHKEGGWRYQPKQPGDISVLGWQLMALKSALLGNIKVSTSTVGMAEFWLDRVQSGGGAYYGYQHPGKMISPTSIGLLSRMYLGWGREDPRLHKGVAYLAEEGPSQSDMYYNYYATNVLCHYGGPQWENWNDEMKAYLLKTQSQRGFTNGSWYFEDQHAKVGGRLYVTCLSTMILEVYYRHMPLYTEQSLDFTF